MHRLQKVCCSLSAMRRTFLEWRAAQARKGIEGLSDLTLLALLLICSLFVSLSGLALKEIWPTYDQLLHYLPLMPIKIRLLVGLMGIAPLCLFAWVVIITPIVKALSDEFIRRFKVKPSAP